MKREKIFKVKNENKISLLRNFSLKTKILNKIISLLDFISSNKKKFLIVDGFSNIINIKLNLNSFQLPFPTLKYFNNNIVINKKILITIKEKNISKRKSR